jgi:hypothetical protein
MEKRFTTILGLVLMLCIQTYAQSFETAEDAVKNMGIGWNLGNTLEANAQTVTDVNNDAYWGQQGVESETCWGQPKTTREFIKMLKAAGFTAIRVPVTWYNHLNKENEIDNAWMARVKEVVDYVIDEGLYCIINVHHDTGADSRDANGNLTGYHWLKADPDNYTLSAARLIGLWEQIAMTFKDYDQKLLFEGFNEILDGNSCWNYPTWSANGAYDEEYAKKAYQAVNDYNQAFVTTVRLTGGNNATRNLIVNTYAASSGGIWGNNTHPQEPLTEMTLPNDDTSGHLIFEVHRYPNIQNGLANAKKDVDATIESLNTILKPKGAPVIFGEWGTSNVDNGSDYIDRRQSMIEFCEYFVKQCKANDIATFYWMGLSDGSNRTIPAFNQADLVERIMKAYYGEDYNGQWPNADDFEMNYIVNYTQQWAEVNLFVGNANLTSYKGLRIEMAEDNHNGSLQLKVYGDADNKEQFLNLTENSNTTTITFNSSKLGSKVTRVTLQYKLTENSYNATITKAVLIKNDNTEETLKASAFWGCTVVSLSLGSNGIYTPIIKHADGNIYNLNGQRISKPSKGIYIQNGRKYLVR